MTVSRLEAINRASRAAVAHARNIREPIDNAVPYYGYVDVDVYECPPFIMFTNNDTPVIDYILREGTFEPHSVKLWCRLCKAATGILDIGANVGIYSLCAALLRPDLKIHAFEPNPYAYARLRLHKELNNALNIIEHRFAVGEKNKIVPFSWVVKPGGNIASGAGIGRRERTDVEEISAHMIKLDGTRIAETLGANTLIKIDVEGGEALTFNGMSEILALRPDIILETFSEEACVSINAILEPYGYTAYLIREKEGQLIARSGLQPADTNEGHDFNQFLTVRPLPDLA